MKRVFNTKCGLKFTIFKYKDGFKYCETHLRDLYITESSQRKYPNYESAVKGLKRYVKSCYGVILE